MSSARTTPTSARALLWVVGGAVLIAVSLAVVARTRASTQARVRVAAADFELGARDGEADERPPHRVHVAAFAIDRREVSVADYAECVKRGGCSAAGTFHERCVGQGKDGNLPVNCVTYQQAVRYCAFRKGRLPSEAEWEFAARRGEARVYPWGNAEPVAQPCWKGKAPCRVGSSRDDRSAFGLWDMGGNVAEWTSSPYCEYARPERCKAGVRVTRGGSFDVPDAHFLRATFRDWVKEEDAGFNLGLRCAYD